jgi:hypothetical protein
MSIEFGLMAKVIAAPQSDVIVAVEPFAVVLKMIPK